MCDVHASAGESATYTRADDVVDVRASERRERLERQDVLGSVFRCAAMAYERAKIAPTNDVERSITKLDPCHVKEARR